MANLSQQQKNKLVKLLLLGESKSGKTGALASLVKAGYKLFIVDFDAGLDYLAANLEEEDPKLLENVVFETFRDKTKLTSTRDVIIEGKAKAFANAFDALDKGIDESGPAKDLGPEWIVVIDSLWSAGRAALFEHMKLQPSKDRRQNYGGAQGMIMAMLENLMDPTFNTNVIVITHMTLIELESGVVKSMPAAVGKAICEDIPKLFNRLLVAEVKGAGSKTRRVISTVPTQASSIAATSGATEGKVPNELPLNTGLATFFKLITGEK